MTSVVSQTTNKQTLVESTDTSTVSMYQSPDVNHQNTPNTRFKPNVLIVQKLQATIDELCLCEFIETVNKDVFYRSTPVLQHVTVLRQNRPHSLHKSHPSFPKIVLSVRYRVCLHFVGI